jgi:hypothetical protein
MATEQGVKFKTRAESSPSGGMRIDDHSWWAGAHGKDSVFPDGPHKCKDESSAVGAGNLPKYEDTTEAIRASQVEGVKKVKAHPMKQPGYRN